MGKQHQIEYNQVPLNTLKLESNKSIQRGGKLAIKGVDGGHYGLHKTLEDQLGNVLTEMPRVHISTILYFQVKFPPNKLQTASPYSILCCNKYPIFPEQKVVGKINALIAYNLTF